MYGSKKFLKNITSVRAFCLMFLSHKIWKHWIPSRYILEYILIQWNIMHCYNTNHFNMVFQFPAFLYIYDIVMCFLIFQGKGRLFGIILCTLTEWLHLVTITANDFLCSFTIKTVMWRGPLADNNGENNESSVQGQRNLCDELH